MPDATFTAVEVTEHDDPKNDATAWPYAVSWPPFCKISAGAPGDQFHAADPAPLPSTACTTCCQLASTLWPLVLSPYSPIITGTDPEALCIVCAPEIRLVSAVARRPAIKMSVRDDVRHRRICAEVHSQTSRRDVRVAAARQGDHDRVLVAGRSNRLIGGLLPRRQAGRGRLVVRAEPHIGIRREGTRHRRVPA